MVPTSYDAGYERAPATACGTVPERGDAAPLTRIGSGLP